MTQVSTWCYRNLELILISPKVSPCTFDILSSTLFYHLQLFTDEGFTFLFYFIYIIAGFIY